MGLKFTCARLAPAKRATRRDSDSTRLDRFELNELHLVYLTCIVIWPVCQCAAKSSLGGRREKVRAMWALRESWLKLMVALVGADCDVIA